MQLTVRTDDRVLVSAIREIARRDGVSLNQAVLRLLRKAANVEGPRHRADVVGDQLDRYAGTWSKEEARQVERALAIFEGIDEEIWR